MPREVDEAFCRQQEETPQLQDLIFMGNFSHLDCSRMNSIIDINNPGNFWYVLVVIDAKAHELSRGDFLLDLLILKERERTI